MADLDLSGRPRADIVSAGRMIEERRALFASPPHTPDEAEMTDEEREKHDERVALLERAEQLDPFVLHELAGEAEA